MYSISQHNSIIKNRAAFYAWGGPGTIRLLQTKYFSPRINEQSFISLYDPVQLDAAKAVFGVTDMFVTYSWGFSESTEKQDREFITSKLSLFQERKIQTYAYVQGLNLVSKEFQHKDIWCRNAAGQPESYSRGRLFTCPNNPEAISIIMQRVEKACKESFTGIYVDNMLFGIPPVYIFEDETSFFGCSCVYCQKKFKKEYGYTLPLGRKQGKVIRDYLLFRRNSILNPVKKLSTISHSHGKQFGINLYDPFWHTAPYYFGYEFSDIEPYLDYFVFENHTLKDDTINNIHLESFIKIQKGSNNNKPVFVVSYRNGIGREPEYSHHDMNLIYSESQNLGYVPCYKATEFTTNGVWHALDATRFESLHHISYKKLLPESGSLLSSSNFPQRLLYRLIDILFTKYSSSVMENRFLSTVLIQSSIFISALKKRRYFITT